MSKYFTFQRQKERLGRLGAQIIFGQPWCRKSRIERILYYILCTDFIFKINEFHWMLAKATHHTGSTGWPPIWKPEGILTRRLCSTFGNGNVPHQTSDANLNTPQFLLVNSSEVNLTTLSLDDVQNILALSPSSKPCCARKTLQFSAKQWWICRWSQCQGARACSKTQEALRDVPMMGCRASTALILLCSKFQYH